MYYYGNQMPPQQGWQCPKCGKIMSPSMMWCPFCNGENEVTYTIQTGADDRTRGIGQTHGGRE